MMQLTVKKRFQYRGADIYIRNHSQYWEFMIYYKGNLYSHYLDVKNGKRKLTDKEKSDVIELMSQDAISITNAIIYKREQRSLFRHPIKIIKNYVRTSGISAKGKGESQEDTGSQS